jgi:thiamine-phosphate pyrophosphorylase
MAAVNPFPRFYPIVDTTLLAARGLDAVAVAEALVAASARILQYRHKGEFTQARFEEAKRVARLCHTAHVQFVMNDRADFALLLARDESEAAHRAGVHLGQTDLPVAAARQVLGDEALIGYSTHNERQIRSAAQMQVDYVALGPIFETGSKETPDPVVGIENLSRWRKLISRPLVAIGGITLETAGVVLANGADSVAVISAILGDSGDMGEVARRAREWVTVTADSSAASRDQRERSFRNPLP